MAEVLVYNVVIIIVLLERLFQEIRNPLLNGVQVGFACSCQPGAGLRPWDTFMALREEKRECLDLHLNLGDTKVW